MLSFTYNKFCITIPNLTLLETTLILIYNCLQEETCFVSGTCYADGQSSDSLSCMQCNGQTGVLEQDVSI